MVLSVWSQGEYAHFHLQRSLRSECDRLLNHLVLVARRLPFRALHN